MNNIISGKDTRSTEELSKSQKEGTLDLTPDQLA
jgi:hypothetical protein